GLFGPAGRECRRIEKGHLFPAAGNLYREYCVAAGEVFLLDDNVLGNFELRVGEVPDCLDSCHNELFGNGLSRMRGNGQHCKLDAELRNEVSDSIHREYFYSVQGFSDLFRVGIEGCKNVHTMTAELSVTRKCRPEVSRANQNGLMRMVPVQELCNCLYQLAHREPDAGFPGNAGNCEVFPDLNRLKFELVCDYGSRDVLFAFAECCFNNVQVPR